MAAVMQEAKTPQPEPTVAPLQGRARPSSVARLAHLHAEAEETARLANLLGRSLYGAIALPLLGAVAIGLTESTDLTRQLVWWGFLLGVSLAILRAYAYAIRQPFDRAALKNFAKDMSAVLLFAGFAWGSGGFLALSDGTQLWAAVLFAAVPAVVIAALLREREAVFLFLAPMATLTAFASVLTPYSSGPLTAAAIVLASAIVAGAVLYFTRRRAGRYVMPAMLPLT